MSRRVERFDLAGGAGRIEASLAWPEADPRGAALVCHPHPEHGGSMHTKVVYRAARALVAAGFATLRFNFRGVGRSAGSFSGGPGESDDARVALTHLATRSRGLPLLLGGFSFGASVALELGVAQAALFPVRALIGIAPVLTLFDFTFLAGTALPVLLVAGSADPFCPPPALATLQARLGARAETVILPGAGHLLVERLAELEGAVQSFAARQLIAPPTA